MKWKQKGLIVISSCLSFRLLFPENQTLSIIFYDSFFHGYRILCRALAKTCDPIKLYITSGLADSDLLWECVSITGILKQLHLELIAP